MVTGLQREHFAQWLPVTSLMWYHREVPILRVILQYAEGPARHGGCQWVLRQVLHPSPATVYAPLETGVCCPSPLPCRYCLDLYVAPHCLQAHLPNLSGIGSLGWRCYYSVTMYRERRSSASRGCIVLVDRILLPVFGCTRHANTCTTSAGGRIGS